MNNFSPNMLKTFHKCPQKYCFKYVESISAPQKLTPFEKGKKIHALAHYYLRGDDITKLEKTLNQDEFAIWQKLKENEYFNKKYLNSEYNLSCKVGNYWVGGRIDALVKDENHYYILDYKTGTIPDDAENDFQTMIYMLAVDEFCKTNTNLSFIYIDLKNNKNHIIEFSQEKKQKYADKINTICKQINSTSNFNKNKSDCKHCEYSKLCF